MSASLTLTVFAAASLHAVMPALGQAYTTAHPGVSLRYDFDGSQVLAAQLKQGASADVFVSADSKTMDTARTDGTVEPPVVIAHNVLVVVTPPSSPVHALTDLASPNVKVALCVDTAPCGRYARAALKALNITPNVATEEINVEGVVEKVVLNEVDAGIVYQTDAVSAKPGTLTTIEIPAADQTAVNYSAAVVVTSASQADAASFVSFLTSPQAQAILKTNGFVPIH
jgi:molybdate transport system substrate-binding protein